MPDGAQDLVLESLGKKWRDYEARLVSTIIKPFLDNEEFREQNPDALQIPPKGMEYQLTHGVNLWLRKPQRKHG